MSIMIKWGKHIVTGLHVEFSLATSAGVRPA